MVGVEVRKDDEANVKRTRFSNFNNNGYYDTDWG